MKHLILASQSPRRRELLECAGYGFEVLSVPVEEVQLAGEEPMAMALRLAIEKALATLRLAKEKSVVLAADTIVVLDGTVYGKPVDHADAIRILSELVGRNHEVLTAWTLLPSDPGYAPMTGFSRSTVRMREAGKREIAAYVATGEPLDKAGAYAAQGLGRRFVAAVLGPLDNVIGLPMTPVSQALARFSVTPTAPGGTR